MNAFTFTISNPFKVVVMLAVVLCLSMLPTPAQTGPSEDAVRQVGALISKSRWREALTVARKAPVRDSTRATLIGIIAMKTGAHKQAIESFQRALTLGPPRAQIFLYLAWSHYALGQRNQARQFLLKVNTERAKEPFYWLLRGRIARDDGDASSAYEILHKGIKRHPRDRELARELGFVLVAAGAHRQARGMLIRALSDADADDQIWFDGTRVLRALSELGDYREALFYTDILRARLPQRAAQIDALAAHLCARLGMPVAAAHLFVRASLRGEASFAFEAADQYRVARQTRQSLEWNARVEAPRKRLQQRLLILAEAGRWHQAAVTGRKLDVIGGLNTTLLRHLFGMALVFGPFELDDARRVHAQMVDGPRAKALAEHIRRCQRERCQ